MRSTLSNECWLGRVVSSASMMILLVFRYAEELMIFCIAECIGLLMKAVENNNQTSVRVSFPSVLHENEQRITSSANTNDRNTTEEMSSKEHMDDSQVQVQINAQSQTFNDGGFVKPLFGVCIEYGLR